MLTKHLIVAFLLVVSFCGNAQILKNAATVPALNNGGKILDMTYLPDFKRYVVVGEFTSISNGVTGPAFGSRNIAILDSNMAVVTSFRFYTCNGPINTVEYGTY